MNIAILFKTVLLQIDNIPFNIHVVWQRLVK